MRVDLCDEVLARFCPNSEPGVRKLHQSMVCEYLNRAFSGGLGKAVYLIAMLR